MHPATRKSTPAGGSSQPGCLGTAACQPGLARPLPEAPHLPLQAGQAQTDKLSKMQQPLRLQVGAARTLPMYAQRLWQRGSLHAQPDAHNSMTSHAGSQAAHMLHSSHAVLLAGIKCGLTRMKRGPTRMKRRLTVQCAPLFEQQLPPHAGAGILPAGLSFAAARHRGWGQATDLQLNGLRAGASGAARASRAAIACCCVVRHLEPQLRMPRRHTLRLDPHSVVLVAANG